MRTFVFLSLLALGAADSRISQQGDCLVDGAEAVSDLMDSAMFVWASIARCGHAGEEVKCEINIASAIQSVNSMINVILKATDKCGAIHTHHPKCGIAASLLTQEMAGLASSSGGIIQKCFQAPAHGNNFAHQEPAMCVVNIKNTAKSLFKTIKAFMALKDNCKEQGSRACASNALRIVGGFAGIGEFLAGALGQCSTNGFAGTRCAQESEDVTKSLLKVAQAGVDLNRECEEKPEPAPAPAPPPAPAPVTTAPVTSAQFAVLNSGRLYSKGEGQTQTAMGSTTNSLRAAFLPVTAIVSFVGGRFYANRHSEARIYMPDNE